MVAVPGTEYCVNCADEFGPKTAAIPIYGEDFQDIAIIKNADRNLVERINSLQAYEIGPGGLK